MFESGNLSDMFQFASAVWNFEGVKMVAGGLVGFVTGAALTQARHVYKNYRQKREAQKAIYTNDVTGKHAVVGITSYEVSKDINPATGHPFFDQKIRTMRHQFDLPAVFNKKIRDEVMGAIMAAQEKAIQTDNPLVFLHLDDVISKEKSVQYKKTIRNQWVQTFSSLLNKTQPAVLGELKRKPGEVIVEQEIVPVLVSEPALNERQMHILLIDPTKPLPPREDIRFGKDRYAHRYETMKRIYEELEKAQKRAPAANDNNDDDLIHGIRVGVSTGEIVEVVPQDQLIGSLSLA